MAAPINISDDFRSFCEQLEFDLNFKNYKEQLIDRQKLDGMIVLGNQFFYISDFTTASNVFVHSNIEGILGFLPEEFNDFGYIYELTHPDDREFVFELTKRSISFASLCKKELFNEPFKSILTIDFRVKHKEGHYIKLNRQSCCFKMDIEGNMILSMSLFTEVSHLRKSETFNVFYHGDTKNIFQFDDLIKKYQKDYKITIKEKVVLNMLADGKSATDIAQGLGLSVHTIIFHRKNLLRKTGSKNTAELVKFAFENSLI
jgi:DNA-binding CsgD family transcriptional regulator